MCDGTSKKEIKQHLSSRDYFQQITIIHLLLKYQYKYQSKMHQVQYAKTKIDYEIINY